MVKKILSIVLWVATAAALVVLFIFARENYLNTPVKSVNLMPATDSGFVRKACCTAKSRKTSAARKSAPST